MPTAFIMRRSIGSLVLSFILWTVFASSDGTLRAQEAYVSCAQASESTELVQYPALNCFDLIPVSRFPEAVGTVRLLPPPTPFGVAVTLHGVHRYVIRLDADGLPEPTELGDFVTFIAWATPPNLDPFVRLGSIGNGRTDLGEIALNKFTVIVTAEASPNIKAPSGPIIMRGRSPSSLLQPHDLMSLSPLAAISAQSRKSDRHAHEHGGWSMPPMHPRIQMAPGMDGITPREDPFLPSVSDPESVPLAAPRTLVELVDGDSLSLVAGIVRRTLKNRSLFMYAFNGQYPGPLIYVPQAATVHVEFQNRLDHPTTVHWHGVRLDNRFDGVPGVTQDAVGPGETFTYDIHFPDAGLYWYHPHHREDIQQDLGLYGNIVVRPGIPRSGGSVNREEVLMLDDLLLGQDGLVPYGSGSPNFALMGRFGNVLLVNGEPDYRLTVSRGEVVRFNLTNVANTRPFNLSFDGAPIKAIASDLGMYERETMVESIVISPAERYIVDVHFPEAGSFHLLNRVQGLNHRTGAFFEETDTLGVVTVEIGNPSENYSESFYRLSENSDVTADIDRYRSEFARPVDKRLEMTVEVRDLPEVVRQMMRFDPIYFNPVEWVDTMPMMNWISTGNEVAWKLRDLVSGLENMDIDWSFRRGDVVKVSVTNNRNAFHAMQHPLHIHGQRFLVLTIDGVPSDNLVWKDTVLIPVGSEVELLLDLSNPGKWMVHCHIAEHLDSGMMMVFQITE